MNKDYYRILGVEKNASADELKKVYRKKCLETHPDRQQGKSDEEKKKAEEQFKDINEAYSVLSDPQKRANYDRFGTADANCGMGGGGFDPFEFFRRHMGGMGGFGSFGCYEHYGDFDFDCGRGNHEDDPNAPKDGSDVRIRLDIPLEFAIYGHDRDVEVKIDDVCPHCHGTGSEDGKFVTCPSCSGTGMFTQRRGMMVMQSTCPHCHGTGRTVEKKCHKCSGSGSVKVIRKPKVRIPVGINSGETILIRNEGISGINGGKNGNMYVDIVVSENELFDRNGLNLATDVFVSPMTAAIGGTEEVLTPYGRAMVKIPAGIQDGKVLRLDGKGIRGKHSNGDLYVRIRIEIPCNLTKEQTELMEKLKSSISDYNMTKSSELKKKYSKFEEKAKELK